MSKIYSGCAPLPAERIKSGYSGYGFPCADVAWPAESSAETGSSRPLMGIVFTSKGITFTLPTFGKLQTLAANRVTGKISGATTMFTILRWRSHDDYPTQLQFFSTC
jgi:hypothetical protein